MAFVVVISLHTAISNHRGHKRNWTLTRDIFRTQEEHRCASLLRPFPHCSIFSKSSTTSSLISLVMSNGTLHSCICLVRSRRLLKTSLLTSACLPPTSSTPHFSTACPLRPALPFHIANALPIPSSSPHIWPTASHLLHEDLHSSISTFDLTTDLLLVLLFHPFCFISYSESYRFCIVSSQPEQRPAAHRPTNCCSHPFFPSL